MHGLEAPCKSEHYLKGVVAIDAGGDESHALLSNGTEMSWGDNEYGQLGDGTVTGPENVEWNRTPTPVA